MNKFKYYIRKVIFSHLSDDKIKVLMHVYCLLRYPNQVEKRRSFGLDNENVIFYVIRPRTDCTEGLMSLFINVVKHIEYAQKRNYLPIVDFLNYKTQYYDPQFPDVNSWELFFTQPINYELSEVYSSKNVILSGIEKSSTIGDDISKFDDIKLRQMHKMIFSCINFSPNIITEVEKILVKINIDFNNTLGVYLRGTDYIALQPAGHPVQPSLSQAKCEINRMFSKYASINNIFLVTEDGLIADDIKSYYGNKCISLYDDSLIRNYHGGKFLSHDNSIVDLDKSPYQRGLKYIVKLIILSKCNYFVGGNTMGSWAACLFAEESFKDKFIFDLGMYSK